MGEVVNLRRERKRKARAQGSAEATENAAKFGVSKSQRLLQTARQRIEDRVLDGARLPAREDD